VLPFSSWCVSLLYCTLCACSIPSPFTTRVAVADDIVKSDANFNLL
jgi:hypothetical protein